MWMSETCRGHLWEKIIVKLFASSWYIFLTYIYDARSHLYQIHKQIVAVYGNVMNFHLFLHLKEHLAGKKFDDDDEVQEEVMTWFKGQAADFYDSGMQKLVPRLNKYLANAGEYV